MTRYRRPGPEWNYRLGRRELARHRPDLALRKLRAAVDACPAAEAQRLSTYMYWLAIALFRLDQPEMALKSLASAQKLRPRGLARKAYLHRSNDYGMYRRSSSELDDFYAFYSVQVCFFLRAKRSGRFDSNAEKDTVTRLIGDAWRILSRSGKLSGLSSARKLELFKARSLDFPLFGLEGRGGAKVIPVSFRRGVAQLPEERCPCGSGLPYMRCCGRSESLRSSSCE
jgi:hypothetical protein